MRNLRRAPLALLLTLALGTFAACHKKEPPKPFAPLTASELDPAAPAAPAPKVDADRAFALVRDFVAIGKRPLGSEGHKRAEEFIESHLRAAGVAVEEDRFSAKTPIGEMPAVNILGKLAGDKDCIVAYAGHYDTNYPLRDKAYVGANDGGSTTGLLLEMGRVLSASSSGGKLHGCSVWLVFTDAEEAVVEWTDTDSVYGARRLAEQWKKNGVAEKMRAFILLDMIGDADLNVDHETAHSTPWLGEVILRAAQRLNLQQYFFGRDAGIEDDHKPLFEAGVPSVDLIDLNYGRDNVYHHTTEDTLDKLSPKSLEVVGDVALEALRALNTK